MKKIFRLAAVAMAVLMMASALTACAKSGPHNSKNGIVTIDDGVMRKDMTSAQFAKEMGIGENLGNTMEGYYSNEQNMTGGASIIGENKPTNYETCWGAFVTTQECMDGIKAAGFNTVRIPVYWGNMMADDGKFTINEAYFNRVEEIINYARNAGLYVVVNVHHYDEFIVKHYSEDDAVDITGIIWTQIAKRYKEYSDFLIFEGFNENLGTVSEAAAYTEEQKYTYVNRMNQAFVDAVRATGGNNSKRMLIISGYWTNIDNTTKDSFTIPTDKASDRIMVSVHYVDNAMYWTNKIGTENWLDYAKAQCELLKTAFTDKGVQVFIGETTSKYEAKVFDEAATYTGSAECLDIMLNMITDYGFIPVLWDVNNNFYSRTSGKIIDDDNAAVVKEISDKIGSAQ